MGKIQCVSHGKNEITRDVIEKSLKNANTALERKIHDDYFQLKSKWKETNQYEYRVRLDNLIRWYKIVHVEDKNNSNISAHENIVPCFNLESEQKCTEIETHFKKSNNISSIEADKQSISSSSNINVPNMSSINESNDCLYENKLRVLKEKHKDLFLERVFKGPADSFRWLAWVVCADLPSDRSREFFNSIYAEKLDDKIDGQIKKDLNRTLAEIVLNDLSQNKNNSSSSSCSSKSLSENPLHNSLYRVLRAFANVDKEVAYCQGMNFIAGFLLISSDFNEIETLYMLIALFSHTFNDDYGIRGFFSENFPLLKAYTYAFNYFFAKKMPLLKEHFRQLEIPDEVWVCKWIQTLYSICLPIEASMRLYDCILSHGITFIINFSISFVKIFETELMKLEDSFEVIEFFKSLFQGKSNKLQMDIENIINYANKIEISNYYVKSLIKEYQNKTNCEIDSSLYIKYNLNVKKIPTSNEFETGCNTYTLTSSINGISNHILEVKSINLEESDEEDTVENQEENSYCLEEEKVGNKIKSYTMTTRLMRNASEEK